MPCGACWTRHDIEIESYCTGLLRINTACCCCGIYSAVKRPCLFRFFLSGDALAEVFHGASVLFCAVSGSASLLSVLVLSIVTTKDQASARPYLLQHISKISDSVFFFSFFDSSQRDKNGCTVIMIPRILCSLFLLVSGSTFVSITCIYAQKSVVLNGVGHALCTAAAVPAQGALDCAKPHSPAVYAVCPRPVCRNK